MYKKEALCHVSFRHESKLRNLMPSGSLHFELLLILQETFSVPIACFLFCFVLRR